MEKEQFKKLKRASALCVRNQAIGLEIVLTLHLDPEEGDEEQGKTRCPSLKT